MEYSSFLVLKYKTVQAGEKGDEDPSRVLDYLLYHYTTQFSDSFLPQIIGAIFSFTTFSRLNIGGMLTSFTWEKSIIALKPVQLEDGNYLIYTLIIRPSPDSIFHFKASFVFSRLSLIIEAFSLQNPIFSQSSYSLSDFENISSFFTKTPNNYLNSVITYFLSYKPINEEDYLTFSYSYLNDFGYTAALPISSSLFKHIFRISTHIIGCGFYWFNQHDPFSFKPINTTFINHFNYFIPLFIDYKSSNLFYTQSLYAQKSHICSSINFSGTNPDNNNNISNNNSENKSSSNYDNLTIATFLNPMSVSNEDDEKKGVCFTMVLDLPNSDPFVKKCCSDISKLLLKDIQNFTNDCALATKFNNNKTETNDSIIIYPKIGILSGHISLPLNNDPVKVNFKASSSSIGNLNKSLLINGRMLEMAEKMYYDRMIHEYLTFDGKTAYCGFKFPSIFMFLEKEVFQTKQDSKNLPLLKDILNDFYLSAGKLSILPWSNNNNNSH